MSQTRVHLIGVESGEQISDKLIVLLRNCRALVLSKRHRTMFSSILDQQAAKRLIPIAPVQEALEQVAFELAQGDVAILASGDPLFFGIGRTLLQSFGPDRITIYPALSSMQNAFSRFKIPWDDARFLSLHGRATNNLASSILIHNKVFLFTDHSFSPDLIAHSLLTECGKAIDTEYMVHVAENLGMDNERLHTGTLSEIAVRSFSPLNVMILLKISPRSTLPPFGLSEDEIVHSRGLITKNEVRAASLHALKLPRQGVFWDVGAGSGAVGLEAARLFPELQVFAVEREDEQIGNIEKNREHFQAWNLQVFHGSAPDTLPALPAPDRVFIGGSGGQLHAIIKHAAEKLNPGGRIVVNAVLEKTAQNAPAFLHEQGLTVSLSEIRVTRRSYPQAMDAPASLAPVVDAPKVAPLGCKDRPDQGSQAMHPITIIVGQKKSGPGENK
ncbi:MAG: precorrin-6y C5,15-methyltransferase (decarboxylating) subunit CbiE [Proteobacteria bacterium]|nr:precorrin-6y C5,15-methyltransferase (decarboxylating) subunit CbiE [Pseudomonadota bacterium]MBU1649454.1 precorrin-6y C5,15-methyltransferase (decarboxylating) subunit CbiE [Pseudomonadota bacterium]MBU1986690.1 precorrin-6y C5,15-methyltransferase (decarboxylating) subunit CbiE [Pseudomonadota bacterium]